MSRARPYLLGGLGLALITFPFLWLRLIPNFANNSMQIGWNLANGATFFLNLLPLFLVALLIWSVTAAERRFQAIARLRRLGSWQAASAWSGRFWPVFALFALAAATLGLSGSERGLLSDVAIYMLLALGLNITVGMTGLLVLGYAGFYGFGAYLFALLQQQFPAFPWWVAAPIAFAAGAALGWFVGLPCLRLRGDYLAIVTLGFAEAFREVMRNLDLTGADKGVDFDPRAMFRPIAGLAGSQVAFLAIILILAGAVFLVQRLYHSPVGRAWVAIRENEIAAASIGIPVVRMKLLAFSLSAAIAALAGVLYAAKDGFVSPAICEFQQSIMILAMVILGGLGNSYGALLGAFLLYFIPEWLKFLPSIISENALLSPIVPDLALQALRNLSDYRWLVFGAIMVLMMLYRPQGLLGTRRRAEELRG